MFKLDRMSSVDYAWRRMDSASNLMVINAALMFDGPLDLQRLRQTIAGRLLAYPRFRQRVVLRGRTPYWQEMAGFELDDHLQHHSLSQNWGRAELQHYLSGLAHEPLPEDRPLWQLHVLENADRSFAVVFRLHHCIADGIALMDVIHQLTDAGQEEAERMSSYAVRGSDEGLAGAGGKWLRAARQTVETAKLGILLNDDQTLFKGTPGSEKQIVWSQRMSLAEVKAVARRHDSTINDVLCSAIGGALGAYLGEQGERPDVMVRAAMTFNLRDKRQAYQLGNDFGLVALNLHTGITDPLKRLQDAKARLQQLKASRQANATRAILGLAGRLPLMLQRFALNLFTNKGSLVISNLEGPKTVRYLAGARMSDMVFWVPQTGNLGIGVSIISYAGNIQFGVFADRKLLPHPERFAALCVEQFTQLAEAGRLRLLPQTMPVYPQAARPTPVAAAA